MLNVWVHIILLNQRAKMMCGCVVDVFNVRIVEGKQLEMILKLYGCLNLHIAKTVDVKGNRTTSVPFVINAILMMTLILKWCTVSSVTTGSTLSVKASLWISMSACGICQKRYSSFVDSAVKIS